MKPGNMLEQIFEHKKQEIAERKSLYPIKLLEKSIYFATQPVSLKKYILRKDKTGVVAEFKLRSPSKGVINPYAKVGEVTLGYMQAGASALSVLTDSHFFGGSLDYMKAARQENYCPILQKDFILDEYQIIEAKAYGADAILLIASMLEKKRVRELSAFARSIGMEVLMEIHEAKELDFITSNIQIVGINNRNLQTFEVDLAHSFELVQSIPDGFAKIAESGIDSAQTAFRLLQSGVNGLLIGEQFMKHMRPEKACSRFIQQLNNLLTQNQYDYETQSMRIKR